LKEEFGLSVPKLVRVVLSVPKFERVVFSVPTFKRIFTI